MAYSRTCLNVFIYNLFKDAVGNSYYEYIASNGYMIVNNELEKVWKEAVVD
jgi:hypothetical protein